MKNKTVQMPPRLLNELYMTILKSIWINFIADLYYI